MTKFTITQNEKIVNPSSYSCLEELNNLLPQTQTLADKLIQQATTLYFKDPQALADDICKAINNNF